MPNIAVAGTGYVGLSNAVLLAQHNPVIALDILPSKVEQINRRESPIIDPEMEDYLANKPLTLRATADKAEAYLGADYIIVATPTDYDPNTNTFNTQTVETVVREATAINPQATIVIKSTIPVGYTNSLRQRTGHANIIFSPEFLREGRALFSCICMDFSVACVFQTKDHFDAAYRR
jgi:UDPglucose 6-dehydrogenase